MLKKSILITLILFVTIIPSISATTNIGARISETFNIKSGTTIKTLENVHGPNDTVGTAQLTNNTIYDEYAHVAQYHDVSGTDIKVCNQGAWTYNPGDHSSCTYSGANVQTM